MQLILITSASAPTPQPSEKSWEELTPIVSDNVVRLQIAGCDGEPTSMGSGFIVGPHEVMTAAHMVSDAPTITVRVPTPGSRPQLHSPSDQFDL